MLPVLDLGIHPEIDQTDWRLEISGEVAQNVELSFDQLNALRPVDDVSDFHCVTTWSRLDCRWGGVAIEDVLALAKPTERAVHVLFESYDGYTTNLPLFELLKPGCLLATLLDGEPLTLKYGAPVRAVVPHLYAWKSAKFLRRIVLMVDEEMGYWEERGYSSTADPWSEDRFAVGE